MMAKNTCFRQRRDKVVFSRYGYEEVKYDGVEYYILKEENVLSIIR